MAFKLADNIISPLGRTTEENYTAVREGKSKLSLREGLWGIPEPFVASLFEDDTRENIEHNESLFENIVLASVRAALADTNINVERDNVVFILSSTKGNIDRLKTNGDNQSEIFLGLTVQRVTNKIGIKNSPIVVCNACTSGVTAIILAERLLSQGSYDYAIVCGCDVVNRFVVSGFQSFKVLTNTVCRPFDMERTGLNLGEAVATIIFSRKKEGRNQWAIEACAIRNDAFHISTPAKNGEGLYRALLEATKGRVTNEIALINAHGTGTLFNDQMEAVAIDRAGLSTIPINALKGYFGHTMGVAGILETILVMKSLDDGIILASKGFEELGVSRKIDVSPRERNTDKDCFVKLLSGFGGCNAVIVASKDVQPHRCETPIHMRVSHSVRIVPDGVMVDGVLLETSSQNGEMLTLLYKKYISNYAKFYKMDMLSRLGFVATELLLSAEGGQSKNEGREDRAIVFFNRSSSISADKHYLKSIEDMDDYYPSPSSFVYTLPNIVTGEVAIRNHYLGETAFYILPSKDENQMKTIIESTFQDQTTRSVLGGWLDYEDNNHFEADIKLYEL